MHDMNATLLSNATIADLLSDDTENSQLQVHFHMVWHGQGL